MTDRLKGCVVAFDRDIRADDAEAILNAIRQIRGVVSVSGEVATSSDFLARAQVDMEWRQKLIALITPERAR